MADLPMPTPTVPNKPFPSFKVLSLDIYGTLIDWETGILANLQPLFSQIPPDSTRFKHLRDISDSNPSARAEVAGLFNRNEAAIQSQNPLLKYNEVLAQVYLFLANYLEMPRFSTAENSTAFGNSIGSWLSFPDTVSAMVRLSKHYRLVPLSNVDRGSFAKSRSGPLEGKIQFWRVYTAQDVGSYKPDLRNFEYLLKKLDEDDRDEGGIGVEKGDVLHVAQSLFHDHRPAKRMGMRQGAGMGSADGVKAVHERGEVGYGWRYNTLGEFADEVEKQFAEQGR